MIVSGGTRRMLKMKIYFLLASAFLIAGFTCENEFISQVQQTQPKSYTLKFKGFEDWKGNGNIRLEGSSGRSDVIRVDKRFAHYQSLEELNQNPRTSLAYKTQFEAKCKFFVLPSGEIVKKWGWDEKNESNSEICLLGKEVTSVTLEAYAFLLQTGVSLGKVKKSFDCQPEDDSYHLRQYEADIRKWCHYYRNIFDKNLLVYKTPVVSEVEVISRSEWDPREPIRDMDSKTQKAEMVQVHLTNYSCSTREGCVTALQKFRREQTRKNGDLNSNFILAGDGRVYEGLGWNSTTVKNVIQFHFFVNSLKSATRYLTLSAFSLLITEGVRLGRVSEEFTVGMTSIDNAAIKEVIEKWIVVSRSILAEKSTVIAPSASANETQEAMKNEVSHPLRHPVGNILFTTSSGRTNGVPFVRKLKEKIIMSAKPVRSNFYFVGDEVAYEGLGWNHTETEDQVVFEFLVSDSETLPSNQSMLVSTFLIREAVKKGLLRPDYDLMVEDDASMDFENMVRLWDGRIRG